MAFDVKGTFAWALIELCERKELAKITVKDLEEKTGFSRPTFYNHFKDRDDLVQFCYKTRILPQYEVEEDADTAEYGQSDISAENIYEWMVEELKSMRKYRKFMKMACSMSGPNSLWVYMISESRREDLEWHKMMRDGRLTKEILEASDYHSAAGAYMIIEWVLADMPIPEEELADKIIRNRVMDLPDALRIEDENNIYMKMKRMMENKRK